LEPGDALVLDDLPPAPASRPSAGAGAESGGAEGELSLRSALARREKEVVLEALRRSGGVRKEAARLLGIDQRNLAYYFRKHGIDGRVRRFRLPGPASARATLALMTASALCAAGTALALAVTGTASRWRPLLVLHVASSVVALASAAGAVLTRGERLRGRRGAA